MTDTFNEILSQNDRVLKHLDRIRGYIYLATGEKDPVRLAFLNKQIELEGDEMKAESDRFTALVKQFKEEKQMQRKPTMALATIALILIALFPLLVSSVNAQEPLATNTPIVQAVEATTEPTVAPEATVAPTIVTELPNQTDLLDTFMKYGLAIGIVLIIALAVLFHRVFTLLALGVPQFAWDTVKAGGDNVLNTLQDQVALTPTTLDDAALAELRSLFSEWKKTVDQQRLNPTTTGNNTPGVVNVNVTATTPPDNTQGQVG